VLDVVELYRLFAQLADPRKARGIRHHLATVLTVMVFAVLAGARNYREIGDRAADLPAVLLVPAGARVDPRLGMLRAPSGSTIRRVAESVDAQAADLLVCQWLRERAAAVADNSRPAAGQDSDGLFGVALDGKTVRNSGAGRPEENVKLFSAMLHDEAIVIAQLRVPATTTEITQVKALLDPVDLTGAVVTGDAAHTQHTTAQYILEREADYILTVKGNQPGLLRAVRAGFTGAIHGYHLQEERGHGRIVRRETWTGPADAIAFPGTEQIFRIRREVCDLAGQMLSVEIVHGVTSLSVEQASATAVAAFIRRHWGIENKLHWVRDVIFGEDHQHAYRGASAHTTAIMHNLAISLLRLAGATEIKRATERIAADRTRILTILAASHA
jgi:predicted transposase YbfD/YdcC